MRADTTTIAMPENFLRPRAVRASREERLSAGGDQRLAKPSRSIVVKQVKSPSQKRSGLYPLLIFPCYARPYFAVREPLHPRSPRHGD